MINVDHEKHTVHIEGSPINLLAELGVTIETVLRDAYETAEPAYLLLCHMLDNTVELAKKEAKKSLEKSNEFKKEEIEENIGSVIDKLMNILGEEEEEEND